MIDIAYAMGQGGASGGQGAGGFSAFVPIIIMFVIFYFLLIRPQQKKTKDHREMISNLKKGGSCYHQWRSSWPDHRSQRHDPYGGNCR